jgi:hypothetical protein
MESRMRGCDYKKIHSAQRSTDAAWLQPDAICGKDEILFNGFR